MALSIEYFTYEQLRAKADDVLSEHHPEATTPISIQEIVEFGYEITIIPIPGILNLYGIDSYTGKTLKTIHIDQGIFERRSPHRYRFSLAHELGHIELHKAVYEQLDFSSVEEWKAALRQIPENQRTTLEFQAYDFAGLLLVPRDSLQTGLEQALKILKRADRTGVYDINQNPDLAKPYICHWLSKHFTVSPEVIEKRLLKRNYGRFSFAPLSGGSLAARNTRH